MRYIKLFETYKDLYKVISYDEYTNYEMSRKRFNFNKSEIDYLNSQFDNLYFYSNSHVSIDYPKGIKIIVNINKFDDDWFQISISTMSQTLFDIFGGYYLCDGFEGVKSILEKVINQESTKILEMYNTSDFYTIMDPDTIEDVLPPNSIKMTPSEMKTIMSFHTNSRKFFKYMVKIETDIFRIEIRKYEDEWFIVQCNEWKKDEVHYKCDGLEGVEKCINNIMNN